MTYQTPADLLVILLSPESSFDERKAAIARLEREAYEAGYEECAIECRKADHVAKAEVVA